MFRSKVVAFVSVVLLLAAAGSAVYFWRQNVQLRSQIPGAAGATSPPASESVRLVREGDVLPEFVARDTEGHEVRVAARGGGISLLLIYSPSCDRCEAAIPAWVKAAGKLKTLRASVQVIALSVADSYTTVQHARAVKMPFPVVPFPDVELQKKYGATEVPLTVLVDQRGVVKAVWDKPLDEGEVGDVVETVCPECLERAGL